MVALILPCQKKTPTKVSKLKDETATLLSKRKLSVQNSTVGWCVMGPWQNILSRSRQATASSFVGISPVRNHLKYKRT